MPARAWRLKVRVLLMPQSSEFSERRRVLASIKMSRLSLKRTRTRCERPGPRRGTESKGAGSSGRYSLKRLLSTSSCALGKCPNDGDMVSGTCGLCLDVPVRFDIPPVAHVIGEATEGTRPSPCARDAEAGQASASQGLGPHARPRPRLRP